MGQHCTGQNPMQYCPRGFRQHCVKKILCNFALILLGQHCTGKSPMQCCPRGSRQLCIRKMFHSILVAYAILVVCNVVPEAPSNIAQKKIQTVQAMLFEQHLVTVFIYVYIRSFTSRKNIKLCLLYYENELKLTLKE